MRANSPAATNVLLPKPLAERLENSSLCYGEPQETYAYRSHNIRQYLAYIGVGTSVTLQIGAYDVTRPMPVLHKSHDDLTPVKLGFAMAQRIALNGAAQQLGVSTDSYMTNCLETYQTLTDAWLGAYQVTVLHEEAAYPVMLRPSTPPKLYVV